MIKLLIQASQGLIVLSLILVLITILIYHGSGHKIPLKTDLRFGGIVISLILFYFILFWLSRQYKR
jgi:hypothetical protein